MNLERGALFGLLVAVGATAVLADRQPGPVTVVLTAQAWTGTGAMVRDAMITVRDGRIERIEPRKGTPPSNATVVDWSRYTVIPGLVDAHTHLTYFWDRAPGTRPLQQPRRDPAATAKLAEANARLTLETGVTTARDLGAGGGADILLRDAINSGAVIGPRVFVAGQGISASRDAMTPERARMLTEARLATPADWVKVYASRGSYSSVDTTQTIDYDALKAIVETAHTAGRKVAIHSYGASGVKDAVRAGADSIEHGIELDDETLSEMARRGTIWVPTIDHNRFYLDAQADFGFAAESLPPLKAYIERNLDAARRAVKAGVKLAMGSDAVFTMFGQNTRELEWLVKAGMTPEQALVAATHTGAELVGMGDRLGRLRPGYLADLVAVDGNPLDRIDALFTGVRAVMKEGHVVIGK